MIFLYQRIIQVCSKSFLWLEMSITIILLLTKRNTLLKHIVNINVFFYKIESIPSSQVSHFNFCLFVLLLKLRKSVQVPSTVSGGNIPRRKRIEDFEYVFFKRRVLLTCIYHCYVAKNYFIAWLSIGLHN